MHPALATMMINYMQLAYLPWALSMHMTNTALAMTSSTLRATAEAQTLAARALLLR